ncbi:A disintegrin and metalloproteinase with thrombospondin motifs 3 isoform X2 [Patella vulgata]|uniref:A disintegrin and metalloproteinase with thrombospondin motifs 3 isoform X2 n=1 Tax=Patella vulgata TaxID=6465 RepID=UPI0024A9B696|nr:A disintegrin and metalloproteinase with thrombospondin motifs 3 isoform X2 [Patella vulgata]
MSSGCVMEGLVSTVCLLFLLIGIQNGKAEKHFGNIKMLPEHEDLLLKCKFPDILPLKMNFQDKTLDINLLVNHAVSANVPVYVMSENGEAVEEDLRTDESTMAYQDRNNMAAMVITCSQYHLAKKPLSVEGKIIHKGKAYNVELVDQGKGEYVFTPSNSLDEVDSVTSLVHRHIKNPEIRSHRRFKRNTREYLIDVLIMTDYTIYDQWFSIGGHPNPVIKRIQTLANIRKYYTVSYNWVNLIFQNFPARDFQITVFVTGFIISENKTSSFLTEPYRSGRYVYGMNVLNAMKLWIKNSTEGQIPPHDHIQLYSRMDFTSDAALRLNGNKGRAFTGTVCAGSSSVSYVEEMGGFNSADVAAHELTHSFGSDHDGEQNWCDSATRQLMSNIFDPTVARSNLPSDCTIYFVKQYMRNQVRKTPDCVLKRLNTSADVPNMENKLPGIVYEADAQCQQVHGAKSFHCRNSYVDSPDAFCYEDLYCYDPIQDVCDFQVPALGTPCDNKAWCMDGECHYDDRAPERDSDCLFGDTPSGYYNITDTGESCAQRILSAPYDCYDHFFSSVCCKSCAKIKRDVQGCEYGDRLFECFDNICGKYVILKGVSFLYDIKCCETCKNRQHGVEGLGFKNGDNNSSQENVVPV